MVGGLVGKSDFNLNLVVSFDLNFDLEFVNIELAEFGPGQPQLVHFFFS